MRSREEQFGPDAHTSRPRLFQQVEAALTNQLAAGKYAVGRRFPSERELCAEFKVSRPTLREALAALQVQGYIEVRVGSGAYVRRIPSAENVTVASSSAIELIEARRVIEAEAAALAAQRITPLELAALERFAKAVMATKLNPVSAATADRDFHLGVARAARNVALERMVSELAGFAPGFAEGQWVYDRAAITGSGSLDRFYGELLNALRSRSAVGARAAVHAYFDNILGYLARRPTLSALA